MHKKKIYYQYYDGGAGPGSRSVGSSVTVGESLPSGTVGTQSSTGTLPPASSSVHISTGLTMVSFAPPATNVETNIPSCSSGTPTGEPCFVCTTLPPSGQTILSGADNATRCRVTYKGITDLDNEIGVAAV